MEIDRQIIQKVVELELGGVMYWAINQPAYNSPEITGKNAHDLAAYAQGMFKSAPAPAPEGMLRSGVRWL
jgi:hypothetical protein